MDVIQAGLWLSLCFDWAGPWASGPLAHQADDPRIHSLHEETYGEGLRPSLGTVGCDCHKLGWLTYREGPGPSLGTVGCGCHLSQLGLILFWTYSSYNMWVQLGHYFTITFLENYSFTLVRCFFFFFGQKLSVSCYKLRESYFFYSWIFSERKNCNQFLWGNYSHTLEARSLVAFLGLDLDDHPNRAGWAVVHVHFNTTHLLTLF